MNEKVQIYKDVFYVKEPYYERNNLKLKQFRNSKRLNKESWRNGNTNNTF